MFTLCYNYGVFAQDTRNLARLLTAHRLLSAGDRRGARQMLVEFTTDLDVPEVAAALPHLADLPPLTQVAQNCVEDAVTAWLDEDSLRCYRLVAISKKLLSTLEAN